MAGLADQPRRGTKFAPDPRRGCVEAALMRFREKCRFEPETGCVVWAGGVTMGRGHHVPYPSFWFDGKRWFGHRWSAKYIHGLDIEHYQVDHCCPNIVKPNTLCVEHVQCLTPRAHQQTTEQRRHFIHLQVGLLPYEEVYGPLADVRECSDIPYFSPPAWFAGTQELPDDCPF